MIPITKSIFKEIMSALEQPTCEQREADITQEMLMLKAKKMAERGYRFNESALEALRLYMSGYGLFVLGSVGTGKTMFFKVLRNHKGERIRIFSMHDIFGRNEVEVRELMDNLLDHELLLDDVGAEPQFNNYGVKFDILAYLVERRMESNMRTHFTTNMTREEFLGRYGDRIADRMAEMCRSVEFSGESLRSPKANKEAVAAMERYVAVQSTPVAEVA